ncbi:MAG: hypothetical protein FD135_2059 [Comamonadaceae bacterium]|nr:MAG: hypothetical protein FD135_2059 [Comamonadaceae bacterium]
MSLSPQTLSALQTLMTQDKTLLAQVQGTDDAAQAASIIAAAAAKNGIEINEAELTQHFEEASKAAANQALSDSQLEAVAGGMNDTEKMVLVSILSFGIGCALVSFTQAVKGSAAGFDQKFC